MEKVLKFLKDAKVYYLATINDGKPDIRPFGTINMYNNRLYIQTGRVKNCYKQMKENENVSICAFLNGEWLRIDAKAVEDPTLEAEKSMLDSYPELQNMYKAGDGNTVVFYLKDVTATFSSFTKAPEVHKF